MKIAVLGTGVVGKQLATRFAALGHSVSLGSRSSDNPEAAKWAVETGGSHGTFADVSASADVVVNATGGLVSIAALTSAGDLSGKVVIDVSNPLDFSNGFPPKILTFDEGASLGEEIQRALPTAHVVKTLNTMSNMVMVEPTRIPGEHHVFVSGDNAAAKEVVSGLLREIGWTDRQIIDLGGLVTARNTEQLTGLWTALYGSLGTEDFNFSIHRPG
jgi:predicted dinucleotide-binding enzyme